MSVGRPVLVAIKSDWNSIAEEPVVGKDVLELLSSSMYINALSIYREYVQNSADAIEEAVALGLIAAAEKGRVEIRVDAQNRNVTIRDNGTGVGKNVFVRTLVALGASLKRGSKARGFRGVGRLAGLGYCRELIFRSRVEGENEISELVWDCRRLRSALRDAGFSGRVEDLIRDVVRVRQYVSDGYPGRFFEVELAGIVRHGDDSLVNAEQIRDYLAQVGPVPFSPAFRFAKRIEDNLRNKVDLGNVLIYLNEEKRPIYRPLEDEFEARKGVRDRFTDVEFFDLEAANEGLIATGWILHHGYRGAIDGKALIKGLRLRSGNLQVGECDVLDELFAEGRFNSWSVGEIHVVDPRILPNGRRDHFEQNVHFMDLINRLSPLAKDLTHRCRVSSLRRNAIRHYEAARVRAQENLAVIRQGVVGPVERKRLQKDTSKELKSMEKACKHTVLEENDSRALQRDFTHLFHRAAKLFASEAKHHVLGELKPRERILYERFFSLIYECSPNKGAAKQLVDRILTKV